ncbi:hypothetical protein GXW71_32595 [Roseomonas hellenica]|uniref:DNA ligase (ATP) n=1 Tax=Plastoroseomonas hellenica TaxID=2687306 RepID=A0ABS5FAJ0_9PROT|nr:non-homologous end-joining DNA ligase [Plastoroseomonas hellenica]MBR0669135.1 hypothetical protein [Plastoroseomonas hellenica]
MAKTSAKSMTTTKRVARRTAPQGPGVIGSAELVGARRVPMPGFVEPALATLVKAPPVGPAWIHEVKFDGYRLQARIEGGRVTLLTRSGLDWTEKFGDRLTGALAALRAERAILDGELVVEDGEGRSDFAALKKALGEGSTERMLYYVFDVLYLDGYDTRVLPLTRRRALVDELLRERADPIRYSEAFDDPGAAVLKHACRLALEGVVSKSCDHPYRSGRAGIWVKSKCSSRQELVIAGYVPSTVSPSAIGSLVLGAYEQGQLKHVGRVGTGFTQAMARDLYRRLEQRRAERSPFAGRLPVDARRNVRFVRPDLVAEIEFRGWSGDGLLRHASYRGLREDKDAREVMIELPQRLSNVEPVRTRCEPP